MLFQRKYLAGVQVWVDNDARLLREYRFDYDFNTYANARRLTKITEYGAGGWDDGAGTALPATTLSYKVYDNTSEGWGNGQTYPYSRLTAIDNGYGGRIEVDYEQKELNYLYGYHYRVKKLEISDGWDTRHISVILMAPLAGTQDTANAEMETTIGD